jgi:hypothetical protein
MRQGINSLADYGMNLYLRSRFNLKCDRYKNIPDFTAEVGNLIAIAVLNES